MTENKEFEFRGVNHLALVSKDMARTVDFYSNVLGMPLIKTLDLPGGIGQHFFFDMGGGNILAFFWWPDAPEAAPGLASPRELIDTSVESGGTNDWLTAHGSMNHIAFDVGPEKIEEYREKLIAKGIKVTEIMRHDNSPNQVSAELNDATWISSLHFLDPDGIMLEFASIHREMSEKYGDRADHRPATPADVERYRAMTR